MVCTGSYNPLLLRGYCNLRILTSAGVVSPLGPLLLCRRRAPLRGRLEPPDQPATKAAYPPGNRAGTPARPPDQSILIGFLRIVAVYPKLRITGVGLWLVGTL